MAVSCVCRSQMQLRSDFAMAVVWAGSYSSDSTPSLGTSICHGCSPKKTRGRRKKERKESKKASKKEKERNQSQSSWERERKGKDGLPRVGWSLGRL